MKIAACSVVCALLCAVLKPHEGRAGAGGFRSCGGGRGSGSAGAVISGSGIFRKAAFLHGSVVRGILAAFEDRSDCASGADRRCILSGCRTGALGKMVELCGTVLCLCTALPLATMLLELLQELGGGG